MGGSEKEDVDQFNLKRKIGNSEAYRLAENFFIGRWDPIVEVYNLMNKLCATVARPLKAWNRCEEESLCLEREEIRKKSQQLSSCPGFVQRVLIRLVMELSSLSLCKNIGTLPKIHTHSFSQASHGELCVNNQVRIRFHYFRSCVITNSTMQ